MKSNPELQKSLRIAQIVSPWYSIPPMDYGGTESVVYNLTEELIKQGHKPTLFASGDSHTRASLVFFWKKSLTKLKIPWSDKTKAKYHLWMSFRSIKKKDFDIIHAHLSSSADIMLFKLAATSTIPVICTLHSRFPFDRREGKVGLEDKYYLQWSKYLPLISISKQAEADAIKTAPGFLNFIGRVPHGLPDDSFCTQIETKRDHLVWVGRIIPEKGTHLAILAALKTKYKIIIAGFVDTAIPEAVAYFENQVKPLLKKYPNQVTFVGKITKQRRDELLSHSLAFLNPIEWEEPFGLTMIEAMAQGCPVISFKRGAANELIKEGINGCFAINVEDMANKIPKVITTINRQKMIDWTKEHYSSQVMTASYVELYKKQINTFHWNYLKSMYAKLPRPRILLPTPIKNKITVS